MLHQINHRHITHHHSSKDQGNEFGLEFHLIIHTNDAKLDIENCNFVLISDRDSIKNQDEIAI